MTRDLVDEFRKASTEVIEARDVLHQRWRARGIDPENVFVMAAGQLPPEVSPPPGVLLDSDPDFRAFAPFQFRYESLKEFIRDRQPDLWASFEDWSDEWIARWERGLTDEEKATYRQEYEQQLVAICADPVPTPIGWEGRRPSIEHCSLAEVEPWLARQLDFSRLDLSNGKKSPLQRMQAEKLQRTIRNVYRDFDHLRISDRPPRPPATDDVFELEAQVSELLAWVRVRLKTDKVDTGADNRKKNSRRLKLTTEALDCARRYRRAKARDAATTLKDVVREYVAENGGSLEYIYRVVRAHPEQWKNPEYPVDTKRIVSADMW